MCAMFLSFFFLKKLELDCKHNLIQAYESKLREGELVNRSFEVSMVFEKTTCSM